MKEISLDDMRLFVSVVQSGSLSHAGELTGIPVSRLSRRLTQLEQALGTQLLNRGKKGVSLNELGERFFEHSQQMLQQAELAIESVQKSLENPSGLLRISVAADIFYLFIQPYLATYLNENPQVNLEINLSNQKINMIQDGIDLAVRTGIIDNENVVARLWKKMEFGVFASQAYLAQYSEPQSPNDLYQHHIISQMYTLPWRFQQGNQEVAVFPHSRLTCNDFAIVEQQLKQHSGIGILPITKNHNRSDLIRILADWQLQSVPVSLIYYRNRGAIATVRSFVEFLQRLV